MSLRKAYHWRPLIAVLAMTMLVVALACGGEEAATPTTPPTATTRPTATVAVPTATTVAPTATSSVPTATLLPGEPTATATVAATSTPVPSATVRPDQAADWVGFLMSHPGYQAKWGTPQYGGIIKTADPSSITTYNLTLGWSAFSKWQFAEYNSLLMMDPWLEMDQQVVCDLCESFEVSADGKTYTFHLRKGVKFQSEGWGKDKGAPAESYGAELTCEDIEASMEWFANPPSSEIPASVIATRKKYIGHLDNVTCPDGPQGYTAVLNFKYFRNPTLGWLGAGIPIWNKEYREWMDKAYPGIQGTANSEAYMINMGTGPWIPTYADSQSVMKVKKNPNYFRKGAPFADGFEFYMIREYNTKYASLLTGKIHQAGHGSSGLTKAQVIEIQQKYTDKIDAQIVRYNHISALVMNAMKPPFDDWNVRRAVQLALDRGNWDQFMTAGAVKMASPAYWAHPDAGWGIPIAEFQTYPGFRQDKKDEDIAEANRLLDEAFGKGIRPKFDFYVWTLLSRREVGVWAIDQFKRHLNWELSPTFVEAYGNISSQCLYAIRPEAAPVHGNAYIIDPSDTFVQMHSTLTSAVPCYIRGFKGKGEPSGGELARIDKMIEEVDTTLDQARRTVLVRELELYMANERLLVSAMGTMNVAWANRMELKGVHYYNLGTYSQQRLTDYIWLAK